MSAAIHPSPTTFSQAFVNPTQTVAGQKQLQPHLPASQLPASLKRKQAQIAQQNSTDDEALDTPPGAPSQVPPRTRGRDGPKKKKASRACVHCQKAHLTCDDSRPCQRCVKRGIAANCTEGHRKKAKYLLDEEELERLKSQRDKSSAPETSAEPSPAAPPPEPPFDPSDQMFNTVPFDPNFPFGSEAANLEYSILSAILGNPSPPETSRSPPPSVVPSYSSWPSEEPMEFTASQRLGGSTEFTSSYSADQQIAVQPSDTTLSTSPTAGFLTYPYPQPQEQDQAIQYPPPFPQEPHPLQPRYPLDTRPRSPPFSGKDSLSQRPVLSPSQTSASSFAHGVSEHAHQGGGSQLQNINDRVTMPYDYTEGYHFLMKHLPSRFEKNDILRIVRALAIFRPSLIALQMPLSFDDEVFVEKCFQRTLLELDKLISFSGTPTVVWRRTGEICLVAPEFCLLTEWSLDELVGRKRYIYELFENQSVVEYWENFASHAFENTTQSVYSHCVLLKPSGAPVPSTFCLSIRRDLFDLPSVVIGQWLPLL
ncbi:hypothetical protein B0H10DRAFT_609824 [Mycena sp. CBHHK59/15]|nr:hypothetical protein B0H10DRAFT_609824 [Mycena sp. CBHHK59/15]